MVTFVFVSSVFVCFEIGFVICQAIKPAIAPITILNKLNKDARIQGSRGFSMYAEVIDKAIPPTPKLTPKIEIVRSKD